MLLTDADIGSPASRIRKKIEMVKLLEEEDATDTAKIVFNDIKRTFGIIPNLFKAIAAANPEWLEMNWYREKRIMIEEGPLDRKTIVMDEDCQLLPSVTMYWFAWYTFHPDTQVYKSGNDQNKSMIPACLD